MKPLTPQRRAELVQRCVDDAMQSIFQRAALVEGIFRDGFKGYAELTDEELVQAYRDADLPEQYDDSMEDIDDK